MIITDVPTGFGTQMPDQNQNLHVTFTPCVRETPPPVVAFAIGDVVCNQNASFRGVVFDIDPVFSSDERLLQAVPEDARPDRRQPFYHILVEGGEKGQAAYVAQDCLVRDETGLPVDHPVVDTLFQPVSEADAILRYCLPRSRVN